jgi:hypothetical protein
MLMLNGIGGLASAGYSCVIFFAHRGSPFNYGTIRDGEDI